MKLNFWQWLGVVLLIVAIAFWINRRMTEKAEAEAGQARPGYTEDLSTEPATEPTTAPAP